MGSDVVATGSGTINLTGLKYLGWNEGLTGSQPALGGITLGNSGPSFDDIYTGFTGSAVFGTGGFTFANDGSGDYAGIVVSNNTLAVPEGYVSGAALSDRSTYYSESFASLGVTQGAYVWNWGTTAAGDSDSFTLDVGTIAVPEPGSLLLFGTALIGLAIIGRRHHSGSGIAR